MVGKLWPVQLPKVTSVKKKDMKSDKSDILPLERWFFEEDIYFLFILQSIILWNRLSQAESVNVRSAC